MAFFGWIRWFRKHFWPERVRVHNQFRRHDQRLPAASGCLLATPSSLFSDPWHASRGGYDSAAFTSNTIVVREVFADGTVLTMRFHFDPNVLFRAQPGEGLFDSPSQPTAVTNNGGSA